MYLRGYSIGTVEGGIDFLGSSFQEFAGKADKD